MTDDANAGIDNLLAASVLMTEAQYKALMALQPSKLDMLAHLPSSVHQQDGPAALDTIKHGIMIFRYLAELARQEKPTGVTYADFYAVTHGQDSFNEVKGRNFAPSDIRDVLDLAFAVTELNGRIPVTRQGLTIQTGMDSFIWNADAKRTASAFERTRPHCPPYSRNQWLQVFPDGERKLVTTTLLLSLLGLVPDASGVPELDLENAYKLIEQYRGEAREAEADPDY